MSAAPVAALLCACGCGAELPPRRISTRGRNGEGHPREYVSSAHRNRAFRRREAKENRELSPGLGPWSPASRSRRELAKPDREPGYLKSDGSWLGEVSDRIGRTAAIRNRQQIVQAKP